MDLSPLYRAVRDVPDFPKPGILFKDIMPLLADPACFRLAIDGFADICRALPGGPPTKIVGIDARGFLFGAAVAYALGVGVVPVRKKGKLPGQTESHAYTLEYGEAVVEMQADALATRRPGRAHRRPAGHRRHGGGGARLIKKLGGEPLAVLFLIELEFLGGRAKLGSTPVTALLKY